MRMTIWAALATLALAGCASSVKLDEVPVEEKAAVIVPSAVSEAPVSVGAGAVGKRDVMPVVLGRPEAPSGSSASGAAAPGEKLVYFDYDSFAIRPEFQGIIESNSRYLKADKQRRLSIEGHTDERGGREYNLALGQRRSDAVRQALGLLGVAEAQIEAVSFGKEKPAALGTDEVAMVKNRRAELTFR